MSTRVLGVDAPSEGPPTDPSGPSSRRPRRGAVIVAVLAGVLALALMAMLAPWPRSLSKEVTGDAALAEQAAAVLDPGIRRNLSVARISDGEVTFAGFGADEHREFEIASLTKTFTTALFTDAIERGELTPTTTLGEVFPEASGDAATITLEELASHRSGLAPIPLNDPAVTWSATWRSYARLDPYHAVTTDSMVRGLAAETLDTRGTVVYSNYGFAMLGQSLAEVTGMPYRELLQERILDPLEMDETYLPVTPAGLADDAPKGLTASGLTAGPWTAGDSAPTGGLRSTTSDVAIFLQAVMNGTAPGSDAVEPRFDADPEGRAKIGYAWFTEPADGRSFRWHNGITGGFTAFMGFEPDSGNGVIVLNDTAAVVDAAGFQLLLEG
ncbi:MAG: serine hydrolase domain-containing protein [Propionibacteriaceae bacterium]